MVKLTKLTKLIPVLALCACTQADPVTKQYDSVQAQVESVKKALPKECQTEGILAQIGAIETQIDAAKAVCSASIETEQTKRKQAELINYLLIALYVSLIVIALIKRK